MSIWNGAYNLITAGLDKSFKKLLHPIGKVFLGPVRKGLADMGYFIAR